MHTVVRVLLCEDEEEHITGFTNDIDAVNKSQDEVQYELLIHRDISSIQSQISTLRPDILVLDLFWARKDVKRNRIRVAVSEFENAIAQMDAATSSELCPLGMEALKHLRARYSPSNLPILLYTRAGQYLLAPENLEKIIDLRSYFLLKSYPASVKARVLNSFMQRHKSLYEVL